MAPARSTGRSAAASSMRSTTSRPKQTSAPRTRPPTPASEPCSAQNAKPPLPRRPMRAGSGADACAEWGHAAAGRTSSRARATRPLQPHDRTLLVRRGAAFLQLVHRSADRGAASPKRLTACWGQAVNSLVLSGTAAIVPSGTGSTCYQGPELLEKPSNSDGWGTRNFSNKESFGFFLTEAPESARCGSAGSERLSPPTTAGWGQSVQGAVRGRSPKCASATHTPSTACFRSRLHLRLSR